MSLSSLKMNLDFIRTFTVLGQSRNMTEASRKLGVDTSYVSRHIKQLEQELQTKLIIPGPKNKEMQLTEAGKYFFEKYERVYNEILLTEKNYRQIEQLDNCKITLGISLDLEKLIIRDKLFEFLQQYPNINLKIFNGDYERLYKLLNQYSIDFALCKLNAKKRLDSNIQVKKLFSAQYCLAYDERKYTFSDYSYATIILPVSNTDERKIINDYLLENNIHFQRTIEVETYDQMLSYINRGFGVGFVLKESLVNEKKLTVDDLDCFVDVCILYIKDKITPSTLELLKLFDVKVV